MAIIFQDFATHLLAFAVLAFVAGLPGVGLISATALPLNLFERIVAGLVTGFALIAFGGAIAAATGNNLARWLPSALALAAWAFYRKPLAKTSWRQLAIAFGGVLLLVPNLISILHDQTLSFKTSWSYYTDLPFQMALVAETGFRPASVYPWSPDTSLGYTWLFHSVLGAWGQLASLRPDELVLQYWPLLFAVMLPLTVAVFSFRLFKSHLTTALALVTLPFIRLSETLTSEQRGGFQYSVSPTFEFGLLLTLITVLLLILSVVRWADQPVETAGLKGKLPFAFQIITLAILVFSAVGSKGSSWFILLGVAGTLALFRTLADKTVKTQETLLLALTLLVGLAANLLVVGTTAGTKFNLTHLIEGQHGLQLAKTVAALAVVALTIAGLAARSRLTGRPESKVQNTIWFSLLGATVVGFVAMIILKHPNGSESYFWFTALIIWLILAADFLAKLFGRLSFLTFAPLVFAIAACQIQLHGFRAHKGLWVIVAVLAIGFGVWQGIRVKKSLGASSWVALTLVGLIGLTPVSTALPHWSFANDHKNHGHQTLVTKTQLEALRFIADRTNVNDLVLTNQHCPNNQATNPGCYANPVKANPWFMTSAFTGRRVLFESFGYDWQLSAQLSRGSLTTANRARSDNFVNHPSANQARVLAVAGVTMIYVNKTFAHAATFAPFAKLIFDKGESQVWALRKG